METLLSDGVAYLYPLVFLIGMAGYAPQIYMLISTPTDAASISLTSWFIWALSWAVSLLYGAFHLHDTMFIAVASMNVACIVTVIALVMYRRRQAALLVPVRVKSHRMPSQH